ncbi:hypothetical protein HY024_01820 [Candidatus Curtissbacteria bacterium]|nr:hypothetical protein [Candidatus Curtissbacteria bacterium]
MDSRRGILNADDPLVAKMANFTVAKTFLFGEKAQNGIKISHFKQNIDGSSFRIHYNGAQAAVSWKIVGKAHLTSAYAAASVGILSSMTVKQIAKGLSQTKQPEHRLQVIKKADLTLIDDTYNSSPRAALESVKTLIDLSKNKYKVALIGQMRDLGDISTKEHQSLGRKIAKTRINLLLTLGATAKVIGESAKKAGFRGKIKNFATVGQALKYLNNLETSKAVILLKASRHEHLERVVAGLQAKSTAIYCFHCGNLS